MLVVFDIFERDARFGPPVRAIAKAAMKQPLAAQERAWLLQKIPDVIEPFDLAGEVDIGFGGMNRVVPKFIGEVP